MTSLRVMPMHKIATRFAIALICLTSLAGCLGSDPKNLGKKTSSEASTPVTDADSFSISFAFRDDSANGRIVQVQGVRTSTASGLTSACGLSGTNCTCDFYTSATDTAPVAADSVVGISKENNSFTCTISGNTDPDTFTKVRLRTLDSKKITGFLDLNSTPLTLQQVLGDLSINKVNKVYKYTCLRTFFEGEGVSSSGGNASITCTTSQRLGIIMANYDFYLFSNNEGTGNTSKRFGASFWPAICERPATEFARASCSSNPDPRWGLYGVAAGPFNIKIQMTRAPEQASNTGDLTTTYGFAAAPDSASNCPTGLVKVRPYMATPASITAGSIDGINPASTFINAGDGLLNNTVIETSTPATFNVTRQANATPCNNATGSCAAATFGGVTTPQTVAYTPLTPVVCVIPPGLLTAIQ